MTGKAASATGSGPRRDLLLTLGTCFPLPCLVGLAAATGPALPTPADDPLVPDSVLVIPSGPTLILERAEGIPAVGIRVSMPLDPPWPAAARILVEQALDRARDRAESIGAELWGGIQDGRIAFHAIGDARDADELAWIIRLLTGEPERVVAGEAAARERARLDQLAETPRGRLLLEMENRTLGTGSGRSPPVARADEVREVWRRSHVRDRIRILVLGDVPVHWVLANLSRIGIHPPAGLDAIPPRVPVEIPFPESPLYSWSAAAFTLGPPHEPPVLAAAAALRAGLRARVPGNAAVSIVEGPEDGSGWTGVVARARGSRDANAAIESALALFTEESLAAWWAQGMAAARGDFLATASTTGGWLALSDRYFSPDGTTSARAALNRLDALRREDFAPVLERFRETLFRPRVDR